MTTTTLRRLLILPVVALALVACGGGGNSDGDNDAKSGASASPDGPSSISVELLARSRGGPNQEYTLARKDDAVGSECGIGITGSQTGFDESGTLEVRDRAGKLIAKGTIPHGTITDVELSGDVFVSQECKFSISLQVFEQPEDVALMSFTWTERTPPLTITKDVPASEFKTGTVALTHDF